MSFLLIQPNIIMCYESSKHIKPDHKSEWTYRSSTLAGLAETDAELMSRLLGVSITSVDDFKRVQALSNVEPTKSLSILIKGKSL